MKEKKHSLYERYIKRIIDLILSIVALCILSPLMLVLIVAGSVGMKGNPFFFQKRPGKIGKDGKEKIFYLIKFRTMTNEKDESGHLLPDEKRLNRYGAFLRKTSLDELPQLINILAGSCSLIGPRPLLVRYLDRYSEEQRRRHEVRPGLTGYAQVHGRNALSWQEKFKMDVYYVDNLSFGLDVRIFLDTVKVVFMRSDINSETSATMEEFMGNGVQIK